MQKNYTGGAFGLPDYDRSGLSDKDGLSDLLPRSMYLIDAEGHLLRWSSWLRDRIAGCSDSQMAEINVLDLIHPEDRDLFRLWMRTILEGDVEERVEARVLVKGGPAYRWFLLLANRFERSGRLFITGTGVDITRLKQHAASLEQSERRYRTMFQQTGSPVFIANSRSVIEYVSPAFEELSGYAASECFGKPVMQFFDGREEGALDAMEFLSGGVQARHDAVRIDERTLRRRDGSICHVEVKLQPYCDHRTEGVIGVLSDLSQRKRLESLNEFRLDLLNMADLFSSEQILQAALDEAERLTDSAFGFVYLLSGQMATLPTPLWSARIREQMQALNSSGRHHPFEVMALLEQAIETGQPVMVNDGGMPSELNFPTHHPMVRRRLCVPVMKSGQVVAVFMLANKPSPYVESDAQWVGTLADLVCDIVTRKLREQSESRTQSLLLQIQKMELVGKLAGGIAHDFNNMLGVILGNTELAMSSEELSAPVEEYLAEIYQAAERSAEMTSQLLAFARKQVAVPSLLDVDEAIGESLAILQRVAGQNIRFEWRPSGSGCRQVRIDPSQFDQILINLCLNARDAMDGEGSIVIESRRVEFSGKEAEGHSGKLMLAGQYLLISVIDSGRGISEEHKHHIFEPFFTTKVLGTGSGLGLSSIYGIVKQNRGFVDFESRQGEGSTFNVYLPLADQQVNETPVELYGPDAGDQPTILVVEDEPEILSMCRMMLQNSGFSVLTANGPSEAMSIAEACGGTIELLLTDIVMPEMNGVELASKLSTILPGLKVLFMSGYSADVIADNGLPDDVFNLIRKPFTIKTLAGKVRDMLEES